MLVWGFALLENPSQKNSPELNFYRLPFYWRLKIKPGLPCRCLGLLRGVLLKGVKAACGDWEYPILTLIEDNSNSNSNPRANAP